jgi:excisionase family DNA binding protein
MDEEPLMTIGEAARLLGVSPITLRRWSDEGRIPVVVLPSGHRRYQPDDIRNLRAAS